MKNTDTAGHKGYDAGKKVSGIKRHIAVEARIAPWDTRDYRRRYRAGALAMLTGAETASVKCRRAGRYTGEPFATAVQGLLGPRWK